MKLHALAGHDEARARVAGALLRGTLPASLLIHGPVGVGKQRFALWVAQMALCERPEGAGPCGACRSCALAVSLQHPDLHWFFPLPRPKGASGPDRLAEALEDARGAALAEIRSAPLRPSWRTEPMGLYLAAVRTLRRMASRRPSMSPRQVFIVGDADALISQEGSEQAANALLKLLEEPPEGAVFILTSSQPSQLLPTIRSRTVPLFLAPLGIGAVEGFLTDVAGASPDDAGRAAALSLGSIGRALGFLPDGDDPGPLESLRQDALELLRASLAGGPASAWRAGLHQPPAGARGLLDLLSFLEEWIRDLAAAAAGHTSSLVAAEASEGLRKLVRDRGIPAARIARALPVVDEARVLATGNVNPQLLVAGMVRDVARTLDDSPSRDAGASRATRTER